MSLAHLDLEAEWIVARISPLVKPPEELSFIDLVSMGEERSWTLRRWLTRCSMRLMSEPWFLLPRLQKPRREPLRDPADDAAVDLQPAEPAQSEGVEPVQEAEARPSVPQPLPPLSDEDLQSLAFWHAARRWVPHVEDVGQRAHLRRQIESELRVLEGRSSSAGGRAAERRALAEELRSAGFGRR